MNSIIYDDEIITPKDNRWKYYKKFLNKLDKRTCVKFALFCAKYVNNNSKENNICIGLVEEWLKDEKSVSKQELHDAANAASYAASYANASATYATYATYVANVANATANATAYATANVANVGNAFATVDSAAAAFAADAAYYVIYSSNVVVSVSIDIINKYLQILLRKTKQFQNNKILEQISKTDVDKLELVDWNMITDIMQEEYNIIHEFDYEDIFSRRCLIELLRREYYEQYRI